VATHPDPVVTTGSTSSRGYPALVVLALSLGIAVCLMACGEDASSGSCPKRSVLELLAGLGDERARQIANPRPSTRSLLECLQCKDDRRGLAAVILIRRGEHIPSDILTRLQHSSMPVDRGAHLYYLLTRIPPVEALWTHLTEEADTGVRHAALAEMLQRKRFRRDIRMVLQLRRELGPFPGRGMWAADVLGRLVPEARLEISATGPASREALADSWRDWLDRFARQLAWDESRGAYLKRAR